ncbi:ANTAR domain-containing protein [Comamonas sp. BIGb0124]|uniref:nitrate regulatory protein n=1 Tax=Comamonas sp. BIGb0124 TaxID=2485130 RepID=UPI000F48F5CB|nr:nitrate regulatory protein [Comamonas sp. BIGb0124]ROR22756.1 ANTAR domain-containing protein [Comamonas sp. BIGb0124]
MKSGLSFLVAARQCEIDELEQLAGTSALAHVLGQLVHELQRERGASNLFVASGGQRFAEQRRRLIAASDQAVRDARACFDQLEPQAGYPGSRARLFSRIAYALHGLDALAGLRQRVDGLALAPSEVIAAYIKLIASLLAVVFEAADSATDPEISRLLVAYFNFMQGKEIAGQERAAGAAIFASGQASSTQQQQLLNLIDAQERCLQTFGNFADHEALSLWRTSQAGQTLADLERMRRIACTAGQASRLDAEQSTSWFDCCTRRIDAMKQVEDFLAQQLRQLCKQKISQARGELLAHERVLQALAQQEDMPSAPPSASGAAAEAVPLAAFFDSGDPVRSAGTNAGAGVLSNLHGYGPQMERAILEMMQEQSHRLQSMSDELNTVRAALHERKVVERAKGLLMAHRQLTEEAAYRMLRQTAMEQNRRLIEVAESVLALENYLTTGKN